MEKLIGQRFSDRYQIESLLGRQTGRRTYLAKDLQTELPVVIKLLLFSPDFTWEDLKLFEREAETLKSLDHPAIPRYLNFFEVETELGKGFALVQSYIESKSLQAWVQSGRTFSEEDLQAIATQLLEILDYLHSRQPPVIHRDIKPGNILLSDRSGNSPGQVHLVDFGSVQTVAHGGTVTVVGTYGYMPPEQFGGRTTPASDLYGLGAALIYLATGEHPCDLPHQAMKIQFKERVCLNPALINWLQLMVEPSLELRFQSAKQALGVLENTHFREHFPAIANKPLYSNVKVTHSRQSLEILIPPKLNSGERIAALMFGCFGIIMNWMGIRLGSVALLGWRTFSLTEVVVATIVGSIFLLLGLRAILGVFRSISHQKLHITSQKIFLEYQLFGIRVPFRRTMARSAITQIEPSNIRYTLSSEGNTIAVPPRINIWAGIKKLEINGNACGLSRLTEQEVDWLAQILCQYLDLPLNRISDDSKTSTNQKKPVPPTASQTGQHFCNPTEETPRHSTTREQLSKMNRPDNAICTMQKNEELLEITTPAVPFNRQKAVLDTVLVGILLECFVFFPLWLFFVLVVLPMVAPWLSTVIAAIPVLLIPVLIVILLLGIAPLPVFISWSFRSKKEHHKSTKIILKIDRYSAMIWEQFQLQSSQYRERRLAQISRSAIQKLRLVYKKGMSARYHVCISGKSGGAGAEKNLLVGNQSFWLSQQEAEWIAYELSVWLNLPITEVEVRHGSAD